MIDILFKMFQNGEQHVIEFEVEDDRQYKGIHKVAMDVKAGMAESFSMVSKFATWLILQKD